jgi:O-antigen ligase
VNLPAIHWQPGYVYPPVFEPPQYALEPLHAAFFIAIALAVGLLAYRRPALGVGALILCAPFADARYAFGTSITVPKAALLGFVIALIVHRTSLRVLGERPVRALLFAFAAVLTAIVLSAAFALHHDAVAREFFKWLEYALVFAAAAVGFAYDPDDRPVWNALIVIAFFEAGEAAFQLLFGAPSGVFVGAHYLPRVAGSLEGPNQFAGWLNLLLPVLFARLLTDRNPWLVAAAVLSAAAEAATLSRSGIVAAVVGAAIVLVVTRPTRRVGFRFAFGAVVLGAILVTLGLSVGLESRFFSLAEVPQPDHLGTRAILWAAALELWRSSPLVGIGAGNFEFDLGMVGHPEVHTHANSLYLQALSETGLAGFAATLYLLWTVLATFARSFSRRPLVIGAFAANVALALHQVFDDLWFFPKVGVFWAVLLAIGVVELLAARDDVGPVPEAA